MYTLWLADLASYWLQVAALVAAGSSAAALLRLREPRVALAYWQGLLAACLLLPAVQPWQRVAAVSARSTVTTIFRIAGGVSESPALLSPLGTWVLLVLAAGVALGLLRLALGLARLNRYRREARPIVPLPKAIREAQALVGVAPAFYFSERASVPVTFGWRIPAVILPERFEGMAEGQQRAIACHELLHVARHHWLVNLMEELARTLFWFQPAVWWLVGNIRLSREQVVDRAVVELTGAHKPYLHALLEMAGAASTEPLSAPLFLNENQLPQRVALLVKEVRMSRSRLIASLLTALAALVVAGGLAVRAFPLTVAAKPIAAPVLTSKGIGKVYKAGGKVKAPVLIYHVAPAYPPAEKKAKIQGTDVLWAVINAKGHVVSVGVIKSLRPDFDEVAEKAIRRWRFKPATRNGKAVAVKIMIETTFRLF